MPAAAVIPAPIAYTKVVAVKKLVVGFLRERDSRWLLAASACNVRASGRTPCYHSVGGASLRPIYFEKNRVFKAGQCLE